MAAAAASPEVKWLMIFYKIEMQDHKMLCMQKVLGWSQFDDFSPEAGAALLLNIY